MILNILTSLLSDTTEARCWSWTVGLRITWNDFEPDMRRRLLVRVWADWWACDSSHIRLEVWHGAIRSGDTSRKNCLVMWKLLRGSTAPLISSLFLPQINSAAEPASENFTEQENTQMHSYSLKRSNWCIKTKCNQSSRLASTTRTRNTHHDADICDFITDQSPVFYIMCFVVSVRKEAELCCSKWTAKCTGPLSQPGLSPVT